MPLKIIFVIAVFVSVITVSLKKPIFGLLFFLGLIFIRPQDDRPNIEALHLPYLMILTLTFLYVVRGGTLTGYIPKSEILTPFLIFTVLLILSAYFGVNPDNSFVVVKSFIVTVATLFFMLAFINDERDLKYVFYVILICGLVFVYLATFKGSDCVLTPSGAAFCGRRNFIKVNINFGQANYLGLTMVMMINLAFAFMYYHKNKLIQLFVAGIIVLFLMILVQTGSRGAILALSASILFYWFILPNKLKLVLIFIVLSLIALFFIPDTFYERMATLQEIEQDQSAMKRLELWAIGLELIIKNPIFGIGINNFEEFAPNTVHNAYIQVASQVGIPALIVWLWLIFRAFKITLNSKKYFLDNDNRLLASMALALSGCIVAILTQSMTTGLAHREFLYIIIAMCGALGMMVKNSDDSFNLSSTKNVN
jgi:O-antigen ligase